jgi:hypothetical protein
MMGKRGYMNPAMERICTQIRQPDALTMQNQARNGTLTINFLAIRKA